MNLILDNIIFALQRTGGISVVWQQHLKRLLSDPAFAPRILEYPHSNLQRSTMDIPQHAIVALPYRRLERFRIPDYHPADAEEQPVFHSSYFRILPGAKNVTTVHDLTYHFYRTGPAKWAHLYEERRAVNNSDAIICVSESTKRDLMNAYPTLPEERVHVVYNGVSEAFYPLQQQAKVTPFEPGSYLLFVGARPYYKNFDIAVALAKKEGMPLVIVGSPLSHREVEMLDNAIGRQHYYTPGYLTENELNVIYNQAFCLIYPSDYEGFGIPPLEAQRAGCPVLVQQTSSLPEVVGDAVPGIEPVSHSMLTDAFSDVITQMRNGRISRAAIVKAGKENAAQFSWDKTYHQTVSIYNSLS